MAAPLILINAVGLTPRLLRLAPRLSALAASQRLTTLVETLPAVTCTAQATILTGKTPAEHGIVANGWLFRDTMEVRFWQQSNRLIQAEPVYVTAKRRAQERGRSFKTAKLFWWFNQGADVEFSVTPKPYYGIDGNKVFGISGSPEGYSEALEAKLGKFPFHTFWGPMAGIPCTQWIARCAAAVVEQDRPDLTLVYLPHLDYDPQRFGPSGCNLEKSVRELDDACAPLLDTAQRLGAQVWVVSEYGHCDVDLPIYLNRVLRSAGLLTTRDGPFGETVDLYQSRAFAICDHQLAHVMVPNPVDLPRVRDLLLPIPGVAQVLVGEERAAIHLDHPRSGEIIALSQPNAWFAYPYWLDDARAPDFAHCVAIHHKPGFDPCEMFYDPKFRFPKLHAIRRLVQKKLGFRMAMDVVPLDAKIVRGSHGLAASDPLDRPLLIGTAPVPAHDPVTSTGCPMTAVHDLILHALDLA
ncbi:alkaline phosphatase family protein [Tuwongella immobilis]|uniref:Alkaline phosphatase family protein n=1 Tax=Tuwongella immobilis TaxID=692036 RepID=A0A6C2YKM3_9BACT|nr:nucleotide pyrophosphatase/phosphodiesterase family protein [Tuwongella immobilis]VIP01924.1 phosphodiesterase : Putative AP superfamily protein OS=Singulisphaera acidiphila (strain ATCC BAA-1392 / DSM 18658 / VKM B-2454 / MOB10) GN=Sinac_5186 PE=4 SV=1: Phosphodiest [Tuwongella immobilis]VTR99860.1 phosphodiesterase : Putative AP superfamily protein OS=Singulisphaera acidiphila (strain ATCC BAA-1392 / DSM 18658 / VKM B-2454 / MOB10) GN=Sinac_5186 PE=4 SV=1: Phosphodiest [Tuwongella immobilis]